MGPSSDMSLAPTKPSENQTEIYEPKPTEPNRTEPATTCTYSNFGGSVLLHGLNQYK